MWFLLCRGETSRCPVKHFRSCQRREALVSDFPFSAHIPGLSRSAFSQSFSLVNLHLKSQPRTRKDSSAFFATHSRFTLANMSLVQNSTNIPTTDSRANETLDASQLDSTVSGINNLNYKAKEYGFPLDLSKWTSKNLCDWATHTKETIEGIQSSLNTLPSNPPSPDRFSLKRTLTNLSIIPPKRQTPLEKLISRGEELISDLDSLIESSTLLPQRQKLTRSSTLESLSLLRSLTGSRTTKDRWKPKRSHTFTSLPTVKDQSNTLDRDQHEVDRLGSNAWLYLGYASSYLGSDSGIDLGGTEPESLPDIFDEKLTLFTN